MIQINKPTECCGCTACASICVHNAIKMVPDAMGFLYPKVDVSSCVNCGLCEKVCSFNEHYDITDNYPIPITYGVRHKNIKEVETSRSGAIFIALSDWILNKGGVVYGVGLDGQFRAVHKRATNKQDRDEFKGSKYVQSDVGNTFRQVKSDLKADRFVLFSGTPCQIAGLKSFIGHRLRERLLLVDIVCHGVASPFVWRDYLKLLEKKEGKTITKVNFRDKSHFGWMAHKETFMFGDTYTYTYTYTYYNNIINRKCCSVCYFANTKRPGDITIADFWGWEKCDTQINADNKGISLVLVNTRKGKDLFAEVEQDIVHIPTSLDECMQPNLRRPSAENPYRDQFEIDYSKYGLSFVLNKYIKRDRKYKLRTLKYMIMNLFSGDLKFRRI